MEDKEIVFVLGGPGSGKGTQTLSIARDYDIGYLSTGDLLRAATDEAQTPDDFDGSFCERRDQLREIMQSGQLVPDEVILALVRQELGRSDKKYHFVDGFPRNISQAEAFESEIATPTAVLYLEVPDEELTRRLLKRGETSGRADDNAESIAKRLHTFHDQSVPVIDYYIPQAKVVTINGVQSVGEVRAEILCELGKFWEILDRGEGDTPQQEKEDKAEEQAVAAKSKCCFLL
jgi:adenylate kinase